MCVRERGKEKEIRNLILIYLFICLSGGRVFHLFRSFRYPSKFVDRNQSI